jgi:hypothetical protein
VRPDQLHGRELWIDGFNILTGMEVALSGGIILLGRDGCYRDIGGVHRNYRKVAETMRALALISQFARRWSVAACRWWLDKPVSNSGRLKSTILEMAGHEKQNWSVELVYSPDSVLSKSSEVVATSDSVILDRCQGWLNLVRTIVDEQVPSKVAVDLSTGT